MNKAVFLDRDGTINVEKNYLYKIKDFQFIEDVPKAIKLLNDNGFKVIIVTNQSGIARGYYMEDDVEKLHKFINDKLKKYKAHIDAFYYCPHHPIYGIGQYKIDCNCRKPKIGLIERACKDFNIDIAESWMVGDKNSDIIAGKNADLKTVLVETGYGISENKYMADYCSSNLYECVRKIILT